ncbi:hypothetical protein BN988_02829 [Oceanobacillus picturae]|uniref:Uncharacterized protein n=1 Tax=Oceanobacillus picturae TaxID=171693 RepID=W9BD99_9BACI|nr:hypothetical protein [Oceanobacillus picturae]CDO04275.1 hypothetical protein BN988_02829 [Oceanobacillus picturae]
MSFKNDHPDYINYQSEEYFMNKIPREFINAFLGFINRELRKDETLSKKEIVNTIGDFVPTAPTTNWGDPFLQVDLENNLNALFRKKNLHRFMDCVGNLVTEFRFDIEDLNELLEENKIGYYLENDPFGCVWEVREDTYSYSEEIESAIETVSSEFKNVTDHLTQAKEQLNDPHNLRDRKDALRDSASAMESLLKYISGINDFDKAVKYIRTNYSEQIPRNAIQDAKTIWDRIHQFTPDVRHGANITSELSQAEALYWIDRIMALIKFLSRELEE